MALSEPQAYMAAERRILDLNMAARVVRYKMELVNALARNTPLPGEDELPPGPDPEKLKPNPKNARDYLPDLLPPPLPKDALPPLRPNSGEDDYPPRPTLAQLQAQIEYLEDRVRWVEQWLIDRTGPLENAKKRAYSELVKIHSDRLWVAASVVIL